MDDTFKTIEEISAGFYSEKGSKFYSFAYPINNENQIKIILSDIQKKYHDARHYVYAYILGEKQEITRCNDDGEPPNSSGLPVLGQIQSNELTNIIIIVVRYFGGIKLGISGLIRAYKAASNDAIANAKIIEKIIGTIFKIECSYEKLTFVQNKLQKHNAEIIKHNFNENVSFILKIRNSLKDIFIKEISENYKIKLEQWENDLQNLY